MPINLHNFLHIVSQIWFTWSTAMDRMTAFRRVGITRILDPSAIDRSRFAHVEAAVEFEERSRRAPLFVTPTRAELTCEPQPTLEQLKEVVGSAEYYKWKFEEQQRINSVLKETPLLPSECKVLQSPALAPPRQSRNKIGGAGSQTMQDGLGLKRARQEEDKLAAEERAKKVSVREAKKAKQEEANATAMAE